MNDLLSKLLAGFIDKFKTDKPTIFMIIVAILTALKVLVDNGVVPLPAEYTQWVLWFIALFVGTSTKKWIN